MSRRHSRPTYFVCSAIDFDGNLQSKTILANSVNEAIDLYKKEFYLSPQETFGPFYKKRTQVIENTRELKFTNIIKKASYNNWIVNAFFLSIPENHAYLVFVKREDNKKITIPKGTIVVPVSELRIL